MVNTKILNEKKVHTSNNHNRHCVLKKNKNNKNIIIIMCTIPNDNSVVVSIAETLINNKLAACITLIPKTYSLYLWNNNIEKKEETQLLIKTYATLESSVFQYIKNQHPYQTPELLTLNISNGEQHYLSWIYNTLTS